MLFSNAQSHLHYNLVVYVNQLCFIYHKQKRVNTLTKKFEWDYFEALSTRRLPVAEEKLHRQKVCYIKTIGTQKEIWEFIWRCLKVATTYTSINQLNIRFIRLQCIFDNAWFNQLLDGVC